MAIPIRKDRLWWAIGGVSGCVLALWNFWSLYVWFDFLHYTTSKKYVSMILCACVGCICVFLYSLFDGKGERYLRLVAVIALVIIFYWLLAGLHGIEYVPQSYLCSSGILVAFICLFYPVKPCSKTFIASILSSFILLLWLLGQTNRPMLYERDVDRFFNYPRALLQLAMNYRTYLEKQNQYYYGDRNITLGFKNYIFETQSDKYFRNERISGVLSREGVSLIVQDGQWYLRVNIPILFPHYTNTNMPLQQRERLISAIKKSIVWSMERWTNQIFFDGDADTYDILVEALPGK